MKDEEQATATTPSVQAGPNDRTVCRLLLQTGEPPEIVYDAVREIRELAGNNIVAAIQAHAAEMGAKLDVQRAEMGAKFDAQKAETAAKFDAQKAEMGTMRTMIMLTISLVGLLISMVGALGALGVSKLVFDTGPAPASASAPSGAISPDEPTAEAEDSVPSTADRP